MGIAGRQMESFISTFGPNIVTHLEGITSQPDDFLAYTCCQTTLTVCWFAFYPLISVTGAGET